MKRIIIFLFLICLSASAFADIFTLIPWNTSKEEVINQFLQDNWSIETDKSTGDITFIPPKDNIYYYGEEIKNVMIHFENNSIYSQTIGFAYYYPEDKVFSVILHMMAKDNAKIVSEKRTLDDLYQYQYKAELTTCNSFYLIVGKNNKMIIAVGYEKKSH